MSQYVSAPSSVDFSPIPHRSMPLQTTFTLQASSSPLTVSPSASPSFASSLVGSPISDGVSTLPAFELPQMSRQSLSTSAPTLPASQHSNAVAGPSNPSTSTAPSSSSSLPPNAEALAALEQLDAYQSLGIPVPVVLTISDTSGATLKSRSKHKAAQN
ncbi:hypothetical protein JAAARDRAFT_201161 [Jaapia argillacea MUCL 33604]|uniref:Uncharacterized protein n=1 Tax=Jaapia argillacea MUCL 33604 TaxID=933084 RepID=A0A067P5G1_9AGAM|nr:hypothetical protein JAAARDRAFT_201161 [Jaapia argillacea MUCL 33604]